MTVSFHQRNFKVGNTTRKRAFEILRLRVVKLDALSHQRRMADLFSGRELTTMSRDVISGAICMHEAHCYGLATPRWGRAVKKAVGVVHHEAEEYILGMMRCTVLWASRLHLRLSRWNGRRLRRECPEPVPDQSEQEVPRYPR